MAETNDAAAVPGPNDDLRRCRDLSLDSFDESKGSKGRVASTPRSALNLQLPPTRRGSMDAEDDDEGDMIHMQTMFIKPEKFTQRIIRSSEFNTFMVTVIMLNMCFVVVEANERALKGQLPDWLVAANYIFITIYSIEIVARLLIEKRAYFHYSMNILDLTIVVADIGCNILEGFIGSQPSISVLRIVRAARLVHVLQASTHFRELWLMLHGLGAALKAMMWAFVLIFVILIIWSVFSVEVLKPSLDGIHGCADYLGEPVECSYHFDGVIGSMYTWFQLIFTGEYWPNVAVPVMNAQPLSVIVFVLAFIIINLGLMNLILTVIVDRASEARFDDERAKAAEKKKESLKGKQKLRRICTEMDVDGSGVLTLEELQTGWYENESFRSTLELLDVAYNDLHSLFALLDEDKSGSITSREFVECLHKMKTEPAQTMLTFIKFHVEDVHVKVTEQLRVVKEEITSQRKRSAMRTLHDKALAPSAPAEVPEPSESARSI